MTFSRPSGRTADQLRPVRIERAFTRHAEGSVLVSFGDTRVLCTASVENRVPGFLRGKGEGWVTAEYGMLPRSTHTRSDREAARGKQGGRTLEIQRLIGRALRACVDRNALGERTITLDCDVLQADGGTRTAAITGAYVALADAVNLLLKRGDIKKHPLIGAVAAVSVGIYRGEPVLDLDYPEDSDCDTDMNVVMNDGGGFIEPAGHCRRPRLPPRRTQRTARTRRTRHERTVRPATRCTGRMSRRIALTTLLVADYDAAIAWYTGALGFQVLEDRALGDGKRWVVIGPGSAQDAGLLLAQPADAAQRARIGDQTGGGWIIFSTPTTSGATTRRCRRSGWNSWKPRARNRTARSWCSAICTAPSGTCWSPSNETTGPGQRQRRQAGRTARHARRPAAAHRGARRASAWTMCRKPA